MSDEPESPIFRRTDQRTNPVEKRLAKLVGPQWIEPRLGLIGGHPA